MMKVRIAAIDDKGAIEMLLTTNKLLPPVEVADLGLCLVVEDDAGVVQGMVSVTMGNSTSAYVDYWAISDNNKRAAHQLISHMETLIRAQGIHRYRMVCTPTREGTNELFESWGAEKIGTMNYYTKEL